MSDDSISRQGTIEAIKHHQEAVLCEGRYDEGIAYGYAAAHIHIIDVVNELPSVKPERDTPKHVLWSGWKGRMEFKCPVCGEMIDEEYFSEFVKSGSLPCPKCYTWLTIVIQFDEYDQIIEEQP